MFMLENFFRDSLGSIGRAILDFYIANAIWLNFIVGGYFVALVIARQKYKTTLNVLLAQAGYKIGHTITPENLRALSKKIAANNVNWQKVILAEKYPFIAISHEYSFHMRTESNLRNMFSFDNIEAMANLLEHRVGKKPTSKGKNAGGK